MASSNAWRECGLPDNFVIQFDKRQRKKLCCDYGDKYDNIIIFVVIYYYGCEEEAVILCQLINSFVKLRGIFK